MQPSLFEGMKFEQPLLGRPDTDIHHNEISPRKYLCYLQIIIFKTSYFVMIRVILFLGLSSLILGITACSTMSLRPTASVMIGG